MYVNISRCATEYYWCALERSIDDKIIILILICLACATIFHQCVAYMLVNNLQVSYFTLAIIHKSTCQHNYNGLTTRKKL